MSDFWKNLLVDPKDTLGQAVDVLNLGYKLALVVDKDGRLVGTVTDGDVRRGLIEFKNLNISIESIMNNNPLTAVKGDTLESLSSVMTEKGVSAVPVLSNKGGVEDLLVAGAPAPLLDNPVFLMAGGFGTRLRPLTEDCPKPLLKVGEKPILETILESFIKAGFHNFYISTHYLPEMIRDYFGDGGEWGVKIQYVHESTPLGTGGAIGLLPDSLPDLPMIVMNGDILTKVNFLDLLSQHNEKKAIATMCVRDYEYQVPYGVVTCDGDELTGMIEKPSYSFFVNAGIYVLDRKLVNRVKEGARIDMPTLLSNAMSEVEKVSVFPLHEYWLDIGKKQDFEKANIDFARVFK